MCFKSQHRINNKKNPPCTLSALCVLNITEIKEQRVNELNAKHTTASYNFVV